MFQNNILDIKFFNGQVYTLKKKILNSKSLEKQLKEIKYTGAGRSRNTNIENSLLPPFIVSFFSYVFENDYIPNEEDFCNRYLQNIENKSKIEIEGIKNRLLRSYPSIIRDFHFYLKCEESDIFDKVYYSLKEDYFEGLDLSIVYKEARFGVALHVNTKRANSFKEKKYSRHDYQDKKEIKLIIDLKNEGKKISNFILYPDSYLYILKSKMDEVLSK